MSVTDRFYFWLQPTPHRLPKRTVADISWVQKIPHSFRNPLFIVPAAMFSVPEWKIAFYKHMPFVGRRHRHRNPDSKIIDHDLRVSMETNLYFVQLEDAWRS